MSVRTMRLLVPVAVAVAAMAARLWAGPLGPGVLLAGIAGALLGGALALLWDGLSVLFGAPVPLDGGLPAEDRPGLSRLLEAVRLDHSVGRLSDEEAAELEQRIQGRLSEGTASLDAEIQRVVDRRRAGG